MPADHGRKIKGQICYFGKWGRVVNGKLRGCVRNLAPISILSLEEPPLLAFIYRLRGIGYKNQLHLVQATGDDTVW